MPLSSCPDSFITLAHHLADISGEVIRPLFRSGIEVEEKSDLSPVTAADRKAEQALYVAVAKERPMDGVIGEEFGNERSDAEYVWVFDPIDGTRAFAAGKPLFGTMIALLHEGKPILGLIDQPILRERWIGALGHPTTMSGRVCQTRKPGCLKKCVANLGPQSFPFGNAVSLDAYRRIAKGALTTSVGGDCYTYGLLASGFVDLNIEHMLKFYDYAALGPIIEGAGGFVRDWKGQPLTRESEGQVLAVGDEAVFNEVVELLQGAL